MPRPASGSPTPTGLPAPAAPWAPDAAFGRTVLALLVLAGVLALFFAPALATRDQFVFRDNGRMHWPVKQYVAGELRQGHFPQWNPYSSLGGPLVAGAIDAVQHPFNLLLVALPFEVGFKAWVLLSYLVAATGAFAWARVLGRSRQAATAAGLAFALSGPLVGSSDNLTYLTTLATIPWVFAAAHLWLTRRGPGRLALVGLASGLCAAGGDPQAWGFTVALLPLYALAVVERERRGWRDAVAGLGAAAAAFVGAAPFILPVVAWMPHSSRGIDLDPFDLRRWTLPLPRLLELVLPHMYRDAPGTLASPVYETFGSAESRIPWVLSVYVGVSVVALAVLGAVRSRPARWSVLVAIVFTWMALGHHAGFGQLLPYLPVLRGFRYWEKMAVWPSLLLAMAAAHGLDEAVARRGAGGRWGAVVAAVGLGALALCGAGRLSTDGLVALLRRAGGDAAAAAAFADNLLDGLLESGAVCLVLGLAGMAIRRGLVERSPAPVLALVLVGDAFAANVRGYTLADPAVVSQPAPLGDFLRAQPGLQRVFTPYELTRDRWPELPEFAAGWMWAGRMLGSSFNHQHRIANFVPYSGMIPARVDRFLRRTPMTRRLPHIGVFGVAYLSVPASPEKAAAAGLAPPHEVAAVDPVLPAFLVRVPHRERAYLASGLSAVDRRGAMQFALAVDPGRTDASVVEGDVPSGYVPPRGQVRIVEDAPERVAVEATSDSRALLVLNDTYAAGWTATVDGAPAEVLPANYLARGVWIGPGRHVVAFSYRTPMLREGWSVLLAGAAALAAAQVAGVRRSRRGVAT